MTTHLYACVNAEEFPTQALLRLRADLQTQPVVVLDGRPPLQTVCSLNRHARMKGAALGMTRLEAETTPGVHLLARSLETEDAARNVLLECAAHFSPRIESVSGNLKKPIAINGIQSQDTACALVLDITGTERLFGPPATLVQRLRTALADSGLRASIAVSANFHAARLKAASTRGIAVIAPGQEAAALGKLPLGVLELTADLAETFEIWGIRTLADLAALPASDLIARLGPQAQDLQGLAGGTLPHAFQPIEAAFALKEYCAFETPVEQIDSLLFIGARMIDCLAARAAARALCLASLTIEMQIDGGLKYERTIRPALATVDRKFLLKLLQLEIAAHPPPAAVLALTLSAQAGRSSKVQLGLFAPEAPEPARLDVTIARLKAIAGEDRVGSPVLEDSHRPGSFRMESFALTAASNARQNTEASRPRMALRRLRPPVPLRVQLRELKPVAFSDRTHSYKVAAAYGPWKSSGCWWSTHLWNTEEWDVLAEPHNGSSIACLLVHDCAQLQWTLEAFYD